VNKTLIAALNEQERLLVAETERDALDALDEDEALALHARIRSARNKYTGQYRRAASARVAEKGGRGKARPENKQAALKAEAFEQALSVVSRRLAVLSRSSAAQLRSERIATARTASAAASPAAGSGGRTRTGAGAARSVTDRPRGDRSLKSPSSEKRRATAQASGARKQAKRDSH
jgi:hypothetical protein